MFFSPLEMRTMSLKEGSLCGRIRVGHADNWWQLKLKQSAGIKPGTYRRVLKWCETEQNHVNSHKRGSCHLGGRRSSVTMDDHSGKHHRKLQSQRPQLTIRKICSFDDIYKSIKLYKLMIMRRFKDSSEGPLKSFMISFFIQIYKIKSKNTPLHFTFQTIEWWKCEPIWRRWGRRGDQEQKKETLHLSPWHSLSRIAPTKNTHIVSKYSTKPAGNGPE